ncbi:MAG: DEAD/DEAH box helicase [Planctomycetes bacterium]|nr:DEAD/DEAH box helicase [Planctomycetota bacterium]
MTTPVLHDYQTQAFNFAMDRLYAGDHLGAGLFLDPGLGKTLITLTLLDSLRELGEIEHALVVAPLRVCRMVWQQEILKWGFNFSSRLLCQKFRTKYLWAGRQPFIELVNPESLHHVIDKTARYDMIVVDESSMFKTWGCKRMKAMRKFLPHIRKRLCLTGTPCSNSLADLHGQSYIIDNGAALGRNVTVFRSRYMYQGGWQGREWMLQNGREAEIHEALGDSCLRLDAETCLDMPALVDNDVAVELPAECVPAYRKLKRELLIQLETEDILAQNAASAYMKMRQFANGQVYDDEKNVHFIHKAKTDALSEVVGELQGKNMLVFYQFAHDAQAIQTRFPGAPRLDGKTKPDKAEQMLDRWNAGKTRLQLVQNQAGSHGLNMQGGGCDVGYYGMTDRPEIHDQSFRRVYRQGQRSKQVRIHRFMTKGTVDDVIAKRNEDKDQTQKAFLAALKSHALSQN